MAKTTYELILLAAGQGKRMKKDRNKVWLSLMGKPLIERALETFLKDPCCVHIIVTVNPDEVEMLEELIEAEFPNTDKPISLVIGGSERQYSSYNGLQCLKDPENGYVMIHEAARPFLEQDFIDQLNEGMQQTGGAILAVPPKDTIKQVSNGIIEKTILRESVWQAQTPQAFRSSLVLEAHEKATSDNFFGTDDASVVERIFSQIKIVPGNYYNIKMTTPEDWVTGEAILHHQLSN
ncbi:2-C-methyl-D-erythritol 4-phosphate cytidylyltransferase [Desemzia sp. FAM 23989]|uniref:2-C-methyl-D-erythritol 4-phosphate cytidylyltransferase n=1 Tax=Desemzia sp. FAM 23989 TaxID=3259523 RepID=UPI0038840B48